MVLYAEVGNSLLQWLANGLQSNIAHSEIHCIQDKFTIFRNVCIILLSSIFITVSGCVLIFSKIL